MVAEVTDEVVSVKTAEVVPEATVTLAGTLTMLLLLLDKLTTVPPVGAAPLSVTVPVVELPPTSALTLSLNEVSAGLTVRLP